MQLERYKETPRRTYARRRRPSPAGVLGCCEGALLGGLLAVADEATVRLLRSGTFGLPLLWWLVVRARLREHAEIRFGPEWLDWWDGDWSLLRPWWWPRRLWPRKPGTSAA